MPRVCVNHPDNFCYICGQLTVKRQRRSLTPLVQNCYLNYFGFPVRNLDKTWTPSICYAQCVTLLTSWAKGSRHMPFAVPMIWAEPKDHVSDCYFCQTSIKGINHKSRNSVNYPNLQSAQRPIPHSDNLPVPQRPVNMDDVTEESVSESSDSDPTFEPSTSNKEPHFITQNDLNDLVRDLDLSKRQAELLASRLHDWNLLEKNTRISVYRSRHTHFSNFFSQDGNIVFCSDIPSVMTELKFEYKTSDWRLFIDSSKVYSLDIRSFLVSSVNGIVETKNHYVKKWPKRDALIPGPQIRNLLADEEFEQKLNPIEKSAWTCFRNVVRNFLGSHRAENYEELVNNLLVAYKDMGCNMSLKIHFLHSHLDFFPQNLGAVSDEHGERFHQDISNMEKGIKASGVRTC
ncbi:hypothetical protein EVAR_85072_1 [Eumeta japonica]|uniref:Uncharacterized protein n=1 Tax=Eumeta variegata TaxID=151549 RepID=A0A4C1XAF3_EUMVA|nr:hypothetical protein EVAR_85072_1 [Eumeta japonica]